MNNQTMHFLGPLANVDSSILKVKLNHGFKIYDMTDNEGSRFVSILEGMRHFEAYKKLHFDLSCINTDEKKFYFIYKSLEFHDGTDNERFDASAILDSQFVHRYLIPAVQSARLFKEGNICIPVKYYYVMENGVPKSFSIIGTYLNISGDQKYRVENSELSSLEEFIHNTRIPFIKPFLRLAFENFELSYQVHNLNLSFLSLMISLESLFNRGQQELSRTISRNTAVLLGKDKENSDKVFQEMRELYGKRSAIVHSGKSDIINNNDVLRLRHYVRESIKEICIMNQDKDDIFHLLNSIGFGDRPWRT